MNLTVTTAYAMIRALKKRGAKGDGEKIAELQSFIEAEKDKTALLDVEKYFSNQPKK